MNNRFQRYYDWSFNPFQDKNTELYDLSVIKNIPIGMFMGADDTTCPPSQNDITKAEIGDMIQFFKYYEGTGHGDMMQKMNGPDYTTDIIAFFGN